MQGKVTKAAREVLGILAVQQLLNLTDREMVQLIQENRYIQYFLEYTEFKLNPTIE